MSSRPRHIALVIAVVLAASAVAAAFLLNDVRLGDWTRDSRRCHIPTTSLTDHLVAWAPLVFAVPATIAGIVAIKNLITTAKRTKVSLGILVLIAVALATTFVACYVAVVHPMITYDDWPKAWCPM